MRLSKTISKNQTESLLAFIKFTSQRNWHIDIMLLTKLLDDGQNLLEHANTRQNKSANQYLLRAHAHCRLIELKKQSRHHARKTQCEFTKAANYLHNAIYNLLLSMLSVELIIKYKYQHKIKTGRFSDRMVLYPEYQLFLRLNKDYQHHLQHDHTPNVKKSKPDKAAELILMSRAEKHIVCVESEQHAWGQRTFSNIEAVKTESFSGARPKNPYSVPQQLMLSVIIAALANKIALLRMESHHYKIGTNKYSLTDAKQNSLSVLLNKIQQTVSLVITAKLIATAIQDPVVRQQRLWKGRALKVISFGVFKSSSHQMLLTQHRELQCTQKTLAN